MMLAFSIEMDTHHIVYATSIIFPSSLLVMDSMNLTLFNVFNFLRVSGEGVDIFLDHRFMSINSERSEEQKAF